MNATQIRHFWDWFRARAETIRTDPQRHGDEISEMLDRLRPGLGWEMGGPKDGPAEFIVRSEGGEDRHATHRIIQAAPPLAGWRFSAWRLPMGDLSYSIRVDQGPEFSLDQFSAALEDDPDWPVLHLTLASPQFSATPDESEKYAGYLALDALLGEKLVEDALDGIEFRRAAAGPLPAARLHAEVSARLATLRGRPAAAPDDTWSSLKGTRQGKPFVALVASGLGRSLLPTHPWRIDVEVDLQDPGENGLPGKEELQALAPVEDRLIAIAGAEDLGVVWTHRTWNGVRTTSFYVKDPGDLAGRLAEPVREADYAVRVGVDYDARWKDYRQFVR